MYRFDPPAVLLASVLAVTILGAPKTLPSLSNKLDVNVKKPQL